MKRVLIAITVLTLAALACGPNITIPVTVPRLVTGPTETVTVSEAAPAEGKTADVTLNMGAGELNVASGADGLASGTIDYNVADWKPTITRSGDSLTIEQGKREGLNGLPNSDVVNKWNLKLGSAPMNLTVNAGAYKGELDLSGLALKGLEINDGASQSTVKFDEVNPQSLGTLRYTTGASNVTLQGLANANFDTMIFKGGAGQYTLDFSGALQQDGRVDISVGVCSLKIVVPAGTAATVKVDGALNDVKTEGTWSVNDKTYSLSGSGPTLTINVDMGVGSLTLVSQ